MPVRNASFIELESYHIGLRLLPFDCFFLAASCTMARSSPGADYWTQNIVELRNDLVSCRKLNQALTDTFLGYCADPSWWTQTIAFTVVHARAAFN
jgi:hypothetical protein